MKGTRTALLAVLLAVTGACSRTPDPTRRPLVVLRFENLTGDPALDWMGRGAARQIAAQLAGASIADSLQPAGERQRAIVYGSTRILHGNLSKFGGRLRLRADLEDAASGKFARSAEAAGPISAGLLPLADSVARQLDPDARPFGAKNETALAAYIVGLEAPSAAAAVESLSRSISADPDFGAAYLALIQQSLSRQDRAAAERFVAMARARGDAIAAVDRARLGVAAAQLSGNPAALAESLAALSRLTPADANLLRALADSELQAKRYTSAIEYYKKALAAQPGDPVLLNALGYAQAYAGDLEEAVKSLREYGRVRPLEANPLDSLGDVHFYSGLFSEAEKFYRQAYDKDHAFLEGASLVKAAMSHLMTGDAAGAEAVFGEYESARRAAHDPIMDAARARWDYLRGKRREAIARLQNFAATTPARDAAALADCTLTAWLLEAGDRAGAAKHTTCRFLLTPPGGSFPSPVTRAYALLLAKNFTAAVPLLRDITMRAPPNPTEAAPVLLAWALVETGQFDEAQKYLRNTPAPAVPAAPFETLIFPRIFYLRAVVAERKGDRAQAEQNRRLFQTLSGPGQKNY